MAIHMDVTSPQQIEAGVLALENAYGPVSIFVSNAGVGFGDDKGSAVGAPQSSWESCMQINFMSQVHAARVMIPRLQALGGGVLVNVASAAGLLAQIGDTAYTASKHAAVGFAKSLAITHGSEGIQVHLVCPQAVATRLIGMDEDIGPQEGDSGFGGNDRDGVISPAEVAACVLQAIAEKRFLVLTHKMTATHVQRMDADPDRWIHGMQRLRDSVKGEMND
jgi:NAD(P)-dependent dehydrogenase (short-subunit alcohol dehydrogenase family)